MLCEAARARIFSTRCQANQCKAKVANVKPPRLRSLGRIGGLELCLVSGERVRNTLDIDFTQGGNEAIYPKYVPSARGGPSGAAC